MRDLARPPIAAVERLTDRSDLVAGINPAFLTMHAILPIGLDGDRLVCAMAMPDDRESMAALAFASGRAVAAVPASRAAILAALVGTGERVLQVRFGDEVVRLRAYLVRAIVAEADHVLIADGREAGLAIVRNGRDLERADLTRREARALIAAADALAEAGQGGQRDAGFVVTVAGRRRRVTIDRVGSGCRLTILPSEP